MIRASNVQAVLFAEQITVAKNSIRIVLIVASVSFKKSK